MVVGGGGELWHVSVVGVMLSATSNDVKLPELLHGQPVTPLAVHLRAQVLTEFSLTEPVKICIIEEYTSSSCFCTTDTFALTLSQRPFSRFVPFSILAAGIKSTQHREI